MAPLAFSLVLLATIIMQNRPDPEPTDGPSVVVEDERMLEVVARDAQVHLLAGGFEFLEGPVWIDNRLIFSDIPAAMLYAWSEGEGIAPFREQSFSANGNTVDRQGRLITCEHGSRLVSRTADGRRDVLVDRFDGGRFNSPNDAVVKRDGTIWFTDPPWGLPRNEWDQLMEYGGSWVFRFDPADGSVTPVAKDFERPNGLCFSPDEKFLYIADDARRHIRRFELQVDGAVGGGEVFAEIDPGGPDGIRCDAKGRLYSTAGDGVHVFDVEGARLGKILVPETPANCGFGGEDGKTLFITARTGLYAIELEAIGATLGRAPDTE